MTFIKQLSLLVFFPLLVNCAQINLYLTDRSIIEATKFLFEYDCLRIIASTNDSEPQQIIPFCLTEWPIAETIDDNSIDQHSTFLDMYNQNITGEELYLWSAPIDLIEEYQQYLNEKQFLNPNSSISKTSFYNCTPPRYGSSCEYSFELDSDSKSSLNDIVYDFYRNGYRMENLTCYTYLKCDRGSSLSCLDWTEICDGYVDCVNDAVDETPCWILQADECDADQYRCSNGQCISNIFAFDDPTNYECLDRSDERTLTMVHEIPATVPTFAREDVACSARYQPGRAKMTSSCYTTRDTILREMLLLDTPVQVPHDCWLAFQCHKKFISPFHPRCIGFCLFDTCVDIMNRTCPPEIFLPATPVAYGHLHIMYVKEHSIALPWNTELYICYDKRLCSGFRSDHPIYFINNSTCRHEDDFPIAFQDGGFFSMIDIYLMGLYGKLHQCNTVIYTNHSICNQKSMYQCQNSTKCITKDRLCDGYNDCDYKDDEVCHLINGTCSLEAYTAFFKCVETKKCISLKNLKNTACLCKFTYLSQCLNQYHDQCQPDTFHLCTGSALYAFIQTHISFYTICDGFTELIPISIDGNNYTDETECDYWQCNNPYTYCDGIWNCFDGSDEMDCHTSALIECPSDHHLCVLPETYELSCLSIKKFDDGYIDCVGATDEKRLCRSMNHYPVDPYFYCRHPNNSRCLDVDFLCTSKNRCMYGDDEPFCNTTRHQNRYLCRGNYNLEGSISEKFLCKQPRDTKKVTLKYFLIGHVQNETKRVPENSPIIQTKSVVEHRCHRGLPLRVWVDTNRTLPKQICLCPPSYYGDSCQYQNQRVSLTLQLSTSSHSRRTIFSIVVTLIDNSAKRIIHSYEQFTFVYINDCSRKFNIYLLYMNRSKNLTDDYSVHIDVYEKSSLSYRASFLLPIHNSFLPVHRVATELHVPDAYQTAGNCENHPCYFGQCTRYFNDLSKSFCRCDLGWTGKSCTIPYHQSCSPNSLQIGVTAYNRPMCICRIQEWGPRCLITDSICGKNSNTTCDNGGQCVPYKDYFLASKNYICICRKGFRGKRCEHSDQQILISFDDTILLSFTMLVHFVEILPNNWPKSGLTVQNIPLQTKSVSIRWARPFHVAFVDLFDQNYYLLLVQDRFNQSSNIIKTIGIQDRCKHFSELFNHSFAQLHLLRRIKYYHLACQNQQWFPLACFYDADHFCFCTDHQKHRVANCFQFNISIKHDCSGQSSCENGARCLQDRPTCPQTSICVCPACFYGVRCQFQSNILGLTLDAILGYYIGPYLGISDQPLIVKISTVLMMIIIFIGLTNSVLSILTFKNDKICQTGCGYYLIGISIASLFIMIMLGIKFWILIFAQMTPITNRLFLNIQCRSIDFLLQTFLHMERWLTTCVSIERVLILLMTTTFNKVRSKQIAKYIITGVIMFSISTAIIDPVHRHLLTDHRDDHDDDEHNKIWCIVTYSNHLQIFNSFLQTFHFVTPFIINIICSLVFVLKVSKQRVTLRRNQTYYKTLREQFSKHLHLVVSPIALIILALPRLIIIFISNCMTGGSSSWLPLIGYLVSYLSPTFTFVVFVLPSKLYKDELRNRLTQYRRTIPVQIRKLRIT